MELEAGACVLRPWATSDREALARAADDREVEPTGIGPDLLVESVLAQK